MDLFDFDQVKAEKASAIRRYNRLRSIGKLFRFLELCVALIFFLWIFTRLPFAVRISGQFSRYLAGVIASHLFVFVLCNAIIVTLIAKSGKLSGQNSADGNAVSEIYEEFTKNSENCTKSFPGDPARPHAAEEIVYEDKNIISEVNTSPQTCEDDVGMEFDSDSDTESSNPRAYWRSKSEKMERESSEKKLRRSETEICRKMVKYGEDPAQNLYPEDDLTNEEFQKTIEAFIAKQLRFRREESKAIVLPC